MCLVGEEVEEYEIEKRLESSEFIKRIKSVVEDLGFRHEVEENVRIHIDDVVMQIAEAEEGYNVSISVSLPSSTETEVSSYVEAISKALKISSLLQGGELEYQLDTSIPDYPMLFIVRRYKDLDKLINDIRTALEKVR